MLACLQAFQFYVPFQHDVPAGTHLFFVPQVGLDCPQIDKDHMKLSCDFVWASAPYPISAGRGVRPLAMLCCWCCRHRQALPVPWTGWALILQHFAMLVKLQRPCASWQAVVPQLPE